MRRRETLIICQQKISIIRQIMRKTKPKMEKSRLQYNHVIGKVECIDDNTYAIDDRFHLSI